MDRLKSLGVLLTALILFVSAQVAAVELKEGAPETYTVKKNDTLWDIASLFLEKPWLWPQLWRNNTQIQNPHLIYPGDIITIRYIEGEPVIEVVREKSRMVLTPGMDKRTKVAPIDVLDWSTIAPYIRHHAFLDEDEYERLPHLLGNHAGGAQFISDDLVLSRRQGRPDEQYRVVRKQGNIENMDGEMLGVQVLHIADAKMVEDRSLSQWLVKVEESNQEARRGDRLLPGMPEVPDQLELMPADDQRGYVVGSLHEHTLLGKHNIVIVDVGRADVSPGTVMGIYQQGPDIIDGETPQYADETGVLRSVFNDGSTVKQPAMKIGELIIFNTFNNVSYGIITRASELVKRGAIVANP
ncbi:LysM peptidoglycan-binding domain-containing protein [Alteromonas sp. CYL-A6]|uniref:LysM peptidoglycan-binding domain-containing protein n=1 Tax=Alteromonas nitratireducens TaxID=3390813 RepID=UPI0034BBF219